MTESDVSIRQATKRFGGMTAVDAIDLEVPRGHFVTFLGPSGCVKTTTLRMIGGFEHPDSGRILIQNQEMGNLPPHKRDTSMVFQNYALFPHMSVADNIGFGLRERKVSKSDIRRRVAGMLKLVELPESGTRKPGQLSGGQQQRIALARSLVVEPTVLLLDEPLGALDLRLRKQMEIELKRIQQYVTHDQEEALTMSDRVVVMNKGHIEQEGSAEEIFEQPRTRFVAAFMGAENIIDAAIADREASSTRLRIGPGEITVPITMPLDATSATIVIRPEKVRLDAENGWPAHVRERVYKGSLMSYTLTLDDGTPIRADVAHDNPAHRYNVGDEVLIGFRPGDIVVIPEHNPGA